jgi:hypothetical protein
MAARILMVLSASLCSARFIFSVGLSEASAFLWPAMWPALRYRVLYRHSGQHDAARVAKKDSGSIIRAGGEWRCLPTSN